METIAQILVAHSMYWSGGIVKPIDESLKELSTNEVETALLKLIKSIIGDDIDTQALVQAKEREKAKHAFTVNETKEAQRLRLCKAFGIEIPEMSHRELREWLKELK